MDERWVLVDNDTGLHVGWYFWLRVLDEVNRSSRYGAPFGLLLLDAELDSSATKQTRDAAVGGVPGAIRATDLGGAIGAGRAGVLLPHQDAPSARMAVERILGRLDSIRPDVRWKSNLLSYPDDAADISVLLTTGSPQRNGDERSELRLPA